MTKKINFPIYFFFIIISILTLYPFWHTFMGSLMTYNEYLDKKVFLWVNHPTLNNYLEVFKLGQFYIHLKVTVFITVIGTILSLLFTAFLGYALSKPFRGSNLIMIFIVITMFLDPGLIPYYILYRKLDFLNNLIVYIVPSLCSTFNLIIMRTYFKNFSKEIEDSARVDGCSNFRTFWTIVFPLSKPVLATIGLFYAVGFWNTFQQSVYFVWDADKRTLQYYLYQIINSNTDSGGRVYEGVELYSETVKLSNMMLVTLPILLVYPFVQKYFVKGVMIGAVKG